MRTTVLAITAAMVLTACTSGTDDSGRPTSAETEVVTLNDAQVETARQDARCVDLDAPQLTQTEHVDADDAPEAADLYELRPGTAGDHLGRWLEPGVYDSMPDERSVIHNHEHGAVSVWYVPDLDARQVAALTTWAEARNGAGLANEAGAGVIVSPFPEGLEGDAKVAFRSWGAAVDCEAFNKVAADGFLLEAFGNAPEGGLAPPLDTVVQGATDA